MSILTKIFSSGAKDLVNSVGSVIDNLSTSSEEKSQAKKELADVVLTKLTELSAIQGEVIKTEMKGNWLQRSWRPLPRPRIKTKKSKPLI